MYLNQTGTNTIVMDSTTPTTPYNDTTPNCQLHPAYATGLFSIVASLPTPYTPLNFSSPIQTSTPITMASMPLPIGAVYHRTDGGAGTSFYVKESGSGNTGWQNNNMKKLLLYLLLLSATQAHAQNVIFGNSLFVGRGAVNGAKPVMKYVRSAHMYVKASDVNTSAGVYNWTATDAALTTLKDSGLYIGIEFWVGPDAPDYLYSAPYNVDSFTNDRGSYPDYQDSTYKAWFYSFIDAYVAHVKTLYLSGFDKILYLEIATGSTGDADYAKAPIDPAFIISDNDWDAYKKVFWAYADSLLTGSGIHLLINPGNTNENHDYGIARGWWLKDGQWSHDYAESLEIADQRINDADELIKLSDSASLRKRGELALTDDWWFHAYRWNIMCLSQSSINHGLDLLNLPKFLIDSLNQDTVISNFIGRHGGQVNPARSHWAFRSIGGMIDGTDITKYPTGTYGAVYTGSIDTSVNYKQMVTKANTTRLQAIADAEGALVDLTRFGTGVQTDPITQRNQDKTYNDVSMFVNESYGHYIDQINPGTTMHKRFRVGDSTTDVWGRFAGEFIMSSGHGEMFFDVNGMLQYPATPKNVIIAVTYKDDGTGSFKVNYASCRKTGRLIQKTNTGAWLTAYITISNFHFNNKINGNCDITLESVSGENTTFAMLQLHITNKQ